MLLAYNLLMLAVDAAAIWGVSRAPSFVSRWSVLGGTALLALLLAALSGEGAFGQMRLLACAMFVHAVIIAAATALIEAQQSARRAAGWGILAVCLALVGVDAFFIEPYWLETTRLTLHSPKVERPVRIVAIADFQTDTIGQFERDVIAWALAEQPDLILLVGDYIQVDADSWPRMVDEFRQLLAESNLAAPLGVFAVKGNIDPPAWEELFRDTQVQMFPATGSVRAGELLVTGLSQQDSLDPRLHVPPAESFQIVFGHHPDYALGQIDAELMIAGHTHGGQVRLPIIGPLLTLSRVPRAWAAGVTSRGAGRTLVVSRGTGLERGSAPRLRFLCRPELVVVQIEPAAAPGTAAGN